MNNNKSRTHTFPLKDHPICFYKDLFNKNQISMPHTHLTNTQAQRWHEKAKAMNTNEKKVEPRRV